MHPCRKTLLIPDGILNYNFKIKIFYFLIFQRTFTTLLYLIKGNLGAGLFAIPAAFKDAGLVGGSIGIPLMALLSIHCMHMLVTYS